VTDPLPPFSGNDSLCVKCGAGSASVRYLPHGKCIHTGGDYVVQGWESNERLHRECLCCGYCWDEAVVKLRGHDAR